MAEKISLETITNPKTHYGPGKAATRSFIIQRLTAALNVVFTVFFLWLVVRLAGAGRDVMVGVIANPVVALVTGLMVISVAVHMRIGMDEVIEDYVHDKKLNGLSRALNLAFAGLVVVLSVAALIKLVFWG